MKREDFKPNTISGVSLFSNEFMIDYHPLPKTLPKLRNDSAIPGKMD